MSEERSSYPWEDVSTWKEEKDFLNWLRSQIRRIWNKHPVKLEYKRDCRFRAKLGVETKRNPSGMVFAIRCEICEKTVRESQSEVDHIQGGFGFQDWEGFTKWMRRMLYVGFDDIRILCKDCHSVVTHSQRYKLTFEQAKEHKKYAALKKAKDQKAYLKKRGFKEEEIANGAKRKECVNRLLQSI